MRFTVGEITYNCESEDYKVITSIIPGAIGRLFGSEAVTIVWFGSGYRWCSDAQGRAHDLIANKIHNIWVRNKDVAMTNAIAERVDKMTSIEYLIENKRL
jgi:hypothetical protein